MSNNKSATKKIQAIIIAVIIIVATVSTIVYLMRSKPAPKETITYFTFSAAPLHLEQLDQMISAFESVNPNIAVKVETAAWADYFTKLATWIAADEAPDIFELNYENFVSYAAKGVLMDLIPLIAKDNTFDPEIYHSKAYNAFYYNGRQYGLPETFSNVLLFYNKDLFDEAGIPYPTEDWTWEDELEAAQKLTDIENGVWGDFQPIQFWEFYKVIAQAGGSFFSKDETQVTINSEAGVEALYWLIDKVQQYHVMPTEEEMGGIADIDLFKMGKLAMLHMGIWMFDYYKDVDFSWDIALEPGNIIKAHHFFSNGVVMSANTEHSEAAWKWMRFFTSSPEAVQIRVAAAWELPALNIARYPEVFESWLALRPPESRHLVFKALDTLVLPPVIERESEMVDFVNLEIEKVKLGQIPVEESLDNMQREISKLI